MMANATAEEVAYVIQHMRPEDVREIWAASGMCAEDAIAKLSDQPYVAIVVYRDEPVAIFGATLNSDQSATMFRFATPAWPTVVREAIKFGRREFLSRMRQAGVKKLWAQTLASSNTDWLRLFGAEKVGGRVDGKGNHFDIFSVDLADGPAEQSVVN